MFPGLHLAELIDEKIAPLYRFALLLTGNSFAAEQALIEVCAQCAPQLESHRNANARLTFYATKLREGCLKREPANPESDPRVVAQIHALPEPERSAIALFYIRLFTAREIAGILNLSLEDLSQTLAGARERLRENAA